MTACDAGHLDIARLLLEAGAKKDVGGNSGRTALTRASSGGHVDIVRLPLEAGANKEVADNNGCTALIRASIDGHVVFVRFLLEAGANRDVADDSAHSFDESIYRRTCRYRSLAARHSANQDRACHAGLTALMRAGGAGHVAIVRILLEARSNQDLTDGGRCTSLMFAADDGYAEIVSLLLDAGANRNRADIYGSTALMTRGVLVCLYDEPYHHAHYSRSSKTSSTITSQSPRLFGALSGLLQTSLFLEGFEAKKPE